MTNLQKKLEQLLEEMKQGEQKKDYNLLLKEFFKEKAADMEENARMQIEITNNVKEVLSYRDMNLTNCLEDIRGYIQLEDENKRILIEYRKLQEFVEFIKKWR